MSVDDNIFPDIQLPENLKNSKLSSYPTTRKFQKFKLVLLSNQNSKLYSYSTTRKIKDPNLFSYLLIIENHSISNFPKNFISKFTCLKIWCIFITPNFCLINFYLIIQQSNCLKARQNHHLFPTIRCVFDPFR